MRCLPRCFALVVLACSLVAATSKSKCDMPCLNGGTCKRRLDETTFAADQQQLHRFDQAIQQQQQRHYCQCPTSYTGALCEIKFVLCDAAEGDQQQQQQQTCPNGNKCQRAVDDFGSEFFHCECDVAQSDMSSPFAAKFCEHASTVFCKVDAEAEKAKKGRHSLGGSAGSSFCTNGGSCKEVTEKGHHHAGCNCLAGFSGKTCEVSSYKVSKKASSFSRPSSSTPRKRTLLSVVVFLGIMLAFVVLGVAILIHHGNRQRKPRAAHNKPRSAQERARIPNRPPVSEIEII